MVYYIYTVIYSMQSVECDKKTNKLFVSIKENTK